MSKPAKNLNRAAVLGLGAAVVLAIAPALSVQAAPGKITAKAIPCAGDNGGLTLSPGFCAKVFADNLGHIRHLTVAPDGVVYANTWSGGYYPGGKPPADGFLVALKDSDGDGAADQTARFGETPAQGAAGGTGVAIYQNHLYAEVNDRIVRYALAPGALVPTGPAEVVVSGLPLKGNHPMHPIVIDAKGGLFIDLGSATNSCQSKDRMTGVPGIDPCVELETRAGIWRYDANRLGQTFSPAERYATGLRNGEGLSLDAAGRLFATQHGRDQLPSSWPKLYPDLAAATELPAEELVQLRQGGDYGWPYCYYDGVQKKLVLAPEYGGDGGKAVGRCADKLAPVAAFPAHWAPNALAIYTAKAFPAPYQGGAFIAFHGSWNRAPAPQDGYNVVFQPLKDGKASGAFVVFADGFVGAKKDPGKAAYRPMGLAVAPDGALYISDDVKGRIWRVTWNGGAAPAKIAAAPAPVMAPPPAPTAAAEVPKVYPLPPGATTDQLALGGRIYHGEAAGGTCAGCHGADGKGGPLGPDLTAGTWMWSDGSLAGLTTTIGQGVSQPKKYRNPMPAMGGATLSPDELKALSVYVWSLGHGGGK
ncbi:PQQ-dependent sugar dehydrogenase [Phenylobacterium aquaticum]|uniref:PQQ-dependent sugar dehydrogenase n=1 Tax=Phenylobacterium aquaticum TaxID=1763816 RepID=UPI0026ECBD58|nr:PQQ-dependent sugar dehydrogenase [Phenylobacterium aquaticum]